jgi:hypothetical protein
MRDNGGEGHLRRKMSVLLASAVVGVVIALISGLIQTPMSPIGIDVVSWGIPLPWISRVIPTRFQSVDWINLTANVIFWAAISFLMAMVVIYSKKKPI